MKEPFKGSSKKNRAEEISLPRSEKFSITLYDVDLAIMEYMRDVVSSELDENGTKIKVPSHMVIQKDGNLSRKDGVLRDVRGRLQLPLVMYKRNSLEKRYHLIPSIDIYHIQHIKNITTNKSTISSV